MPGSCRAGPSSPRRSWTYFRCLAVLAERAHALGCRCVLGHDAPGVAGRAEVLAGVEAERGGGAGRRPRGGRRAPRRAPDSVLEDGIRARLGERPAARACPPAARRGARASERGRGSDCRARRRPDRDSSRSRTTSTTTGTPPACVTASSVATNVFAGTITSSPGSRPLQAGRAGEHRGRSRRRRNVRRRSTRRRRSRTRHLRPVRKRAGVEKRSDSRISSSFKGACMCESRETARRRWGLQSASRPCQRRYARRAPLTTGRSSRFPLPELGEDRRLPAKVGV